MRAHAVLPRTLAHAGQSRASSKQALFDALRKALHQLLGEGVVGGAHQHGVSFMAYSSWLSLWCITVSANTDHQLSWLTVLVLYRYLIVH